MEYLLLGCMFIPAIVDLIVGVKWKRTFLFIVAVASLISLGVALLTPLSLIGYSLIGLGIGVIGCIYIVVAKLKTTR